MSLAALHADIAATKVGLMQHVATKIGSTQHALQPNLQCIVAQGRVYLKQVQALDVHYMLACSLTAGMSDLTY